MHETDVSAAPSKRGTDPFGSTSCCLGGPWRGDRGVLQSDRVCSVLSGLKIKRVAYPDHQ